MLHTVQITNACFFVISCTYVCKKVCFSIFAVPPNLTVSTTKNIESSSIVVQWDAVDDSLITTYAITWTGDGVNLQTAALTEQTSYTITGLTLDTVYTITVTAGNMCGQGPEFKITFSFSEGNTLTFSRYMRSLLTS